MTRPNRTLNWHDGLPLLDFPAAPKLFQQYIYTATPPLRPDRKVRIKNLGAAATWKTQPELHLRVLVSVGKEYHNGAKQEALTDFLNALIQERRAAELADDSLLVTYVIGDSLQSWNLARDNPKLTEEQARHEASKRGTEWIEKEFKPAVMQHASYRWHAMRWSDLKKHFGPLDYKERIKRVKELLEESPEFAQAMREDMEFFVSRNLPADASPDVRQRFEDYSRNYIIEEVAAFSFIPQKPNLDAQMAHFCGFMDSKEAKKNKKFFNAVNDLLDLNLDPGQFSADKDAVKASLDTKYANAPDKFEALLAQACDKAAEAVVREQVAEILTPAVENSLEAQVKRLCEFMDEGEPKKKFQLGKKANQLLHLKNIVPGAFCAQQGAVLEAFTKSRFDNVEAMLTELYKTSPDYGLLNTYKKQVPECIDLYPSKGLNSFDVLESGLIKGSERTRCVIEPYYGRKMGEIFDEADKTVLEPEAEMVKVREKIQHFYRKHKHRFGLIRQQLDDSMGVSSIGVELRTRINRFHLVLNDLQKGPQNETMARQIDATHNHIETAKNMIACTQRLSQGLSDFANLERFFGWVAELQSAGELNEGMREAASRAAGITIRLLDDLAPLNTYLQRPRHLRAEKISGILEEVKILDTEMRKHFPGNELETFITRYSQDFLEFRKSAPTAYAENQDLDPTHRMRVLKAARGTNRLY